MFESVPLRLGPIVDRWRERAQENPPTAEISAQLTAAQRRQLARTIALSEFAGNVLLRDPDLIAELAAGAPVPAAIGATLQPMSVSLRLWRRREMISRTP